jgi:hypothetical protein
MGWGFCLPERRFGEIDSGEGIVHKGPQQAASLQLRMRLAYDGLRLQEVRLCVLGLSGCGLWGGLWRSI